MNYKNIEGYQDLSLSEQCLELRGLKAKIETLQEAKWWLEKSIAEQMDDNQQTTVRHEEGITKLTYPVEYDPNVLAELREIVDPIELAGVYYPPGEKTVKTPEKWNMSKGRTLVNLGGEFREIIDRARKVIKERPAIKYYEKDKRSTR